MKKSDAKLTVVGEGAIETPAAASHPAQETQGAVPATVGAPNPSSAVPLVVLSPHVPAAASLENAMNASLIAIQEAIDHEQAHMQGTQADTRKMIEEIEAKARREIADLSEKQIAADSISLRRLADLEDAKAILEGGLAVADQQRQQREDDRKAQAEQQEEQE